MSTTSIDNTLYYDNIKKLVGLNKQLTFVEQELFTFKTDEEYNALRDRERQLQTQIANVLAALNLTNTAYFELN